MIRFFRYLLGYVEFCFYGGFIEGFINSCFDENINISALERVDDTLVGKVNVKSYKKLHRIARMHGGVVKIIKKHGPIFPLLKIKNRYGLMAGAIAFLFIVNFLSGFVWNVEISGNSQLTNNEINTILSDNGLRIGSHWSKIKRPNIENFILSAFPNCAFAQINKRGTSAVVEIRESVTKPNIDYEMVPTNLKANKDGIIVEAYTHGGWRVRDVGDYVRKGDLLVTGVYESELNKTNVYAHGSGKYIARVREDFDLVVNRKQSVESYKKTKKYNRLIFFNVNLPLYFGRIDYNSCDVKNDEKFITLNNRKLPVGIKTQLITPYEQCEIVLSDEELTTLINSEIEKKIINDFGKYELVSKNIDVVLNGNEARATGFVDCLEDIGEMIRITSDENILCSSFYN